MQLGFYFDQSRCTGCYACVIACRDWHDTSDTGVEWRRVVSQEEGTFPRVELSYVSLSCCHCEKPACREVCPVDAISKRDEDGVMVVDREACLGGDACGVCKEACPYEVPQFGSGDDTKMQMCTFCLDRIEAGKKPACVDACPMRAFDCGPMDELKEKYGDLQKVRGFEPSQDTQPSIIFKPRYE